MYKLEAPFFPPFHATKVTTRLSWATRPTILAVLGKRISFPARGPANIRIFGDFSVLGVRPRMLRHGMISARRSCVKKRKPARGPVLDVSRGALALRARATSTTRLRAPPVLYRTSIPKPCPIACHQSDGVPRHEHPRKRAFSSRVSSTRPPATAAIAAC